MRELCSRCLSDLSLSLSRTLLLLRCCLASWLRRSCSTSGFQQLSLPVGLEVTKLSLEAMRSSPTVKSTSSPSCCFYGSFDDFPLRSDRSYDIPIRSRHGSTLAVKCDEAGKPYTRSCSVVETILDLGISTVDTATQARWEETRCGAYDKEGNHFKSYFRRLQLTEEPNIRALVARIQWNGYYGEKKEIRRRDEDWKEPAGFPEEEGKKLRKSPQDF
ncbi:hypothetical protein MA16_Dca000657 [Dendrobium catenatum]|uniref:Uncharacterized protein n=1 Tax=Dendrobium catenatum TaxID=906689 RepID=A0A2I0WUH2_9ASPA|nr:hypothetical protein MA16_Dca000657 [Dendrobium catenatum]